MFLKMNKPKFFRGNPIIQPGEIYVIEGTPYKVITATSRIVGENKDSLEMTELIYWIDNTETNERLFMVESELESKFSECHPPLH
jgi:hypothetical protein